MLKLDCLFTEVTFSDDFGIRFAFFGYYFPRLVLVGYILLVNVVYYCGDQVFTAELVEALVLHIVLLTYLCLLRSQEYFSHGGKWLYLYGGQQHCKPESQTNS